MHGFGWFALACLVVIGVWSIATDLHEGKR